MSDADQQRQTRALAEIGQGVRQLVKIQEALNANFVSFIREFKGPRELILDDLDQAAEAARKQLEAHRQILPEDYRLGPLGKLEPRERPDAS